MSARTDNLLSRTSEANSRIVHNGQIECKLGKISSAYNEHEFCERLIGSVEIATVYRKDIDEWAEQKKVSSVITNNRHSKVTPEELARKWNVGLRTEKDTLQVTMQCRIRTVVHPMTRRVRVDHLNLHRTRLRGTWYADTLLAKVKSKLGTTCANVFTQGKFTRVVPMTSRVDAGKSLVEFTDNIGIPENLVTDSAGEFTSK